MALTADESRQLGEIARGLSRADPRLYRALSTGRIRHRGTGTYGTALLLVGLSLLSFGVAASVAAVCVIAWVALFAGVIMASAPYWDTPGTASRGPGGG